jgi:hypothetical protein
MVVRGRCAKSGKTDNDEMRGFFAALRMTNENYVQDDGEKQATT